MQPAIPMRKSYSANQSPAAGSNIADWYRDIPQDLPASEYAHRLSTVEARSGLFEQGGYRALNKGKVDSASAVIILESYFEQGY